MPGYLKMLYRLFPMFDLDKKDIKILLNYMIKIIDKKTIEILGVKKLY